MNPFASNITTTAAMTAPDIVGAIVVVIALLIIIATLIYGLAGLENFLRVHRFLRAMVGSVIAAMKFIVIGGVECAAVYLMYLGVVLIYSSGVVQSVNPKDILIGLVVAAAFYFVGRVSIMGWNRFEEIKKEVNQKINHTGFDSCQVTQK